MKTNFTLKEKIKPRFLKRLKNNMKDREWALKDIIHQLETHNWVTELPYGIVCNIASAIQINHESIGMWSAVNWFYTKKEMETKIEENV